MTDDEIDKLIVLAVRGALTAANSDLLLKLVDAIAALRKERGELHETIRELRYTPPSPEQMR